MILLRLSDPSVLYREKQSDEQGLSPAIRRLAGDELSDDEKQYVVYLSNKNIIGYRDAPTLPDQAADRASEAIAQRFIDKLEMSESDIGVVDSERTDEILDEYGFGQS